MNRNAKQSLTVVLHDADSEQSGTLPIRVVGNDSAISIFPKGFGDFGSLEGFGCPVFLELYSGTLRLIVFADISREDPTHVIDLSLSKEDSRRAMPASATAATPLQQGRKFHEMLKQVNPATGRCFTLKEAAASLGVNYATFRNLEALWRSASDTCLRHNRNTK
jgi:hypothetical protein